MGRIFDKSKNREYYQIYRHWLSAGLSLVLLLHSDRKYHLLFSAVNGPVWVSPAIVTAGAWVMLDGKSDTALDAN